MTDQPEMIDAADPLSIQKREEGLFKLATVAGFAASVGATMIFGPGGLFMGLGLTVFVLCCVDLVRK